MQGCYIAGMTGSMRGKENLNKAVEGMAAGGIYSEVPEIVKKLIELIPLWEKAGFRLEDAQGIPYGSRMQFRNGEAEVRANMYYSKKKGYSLVVNPKVPVGLRRAFEGVFRAPEPAMGSGAGSVEQRLRVWIGSDEAGKGDYLGPLVVAAFRADVAVAAVLKDMGVQDSKAIRNQEKCRDIARQIFIRFKDRIGVVELVPETYNRLYRQFEAQNRKLNWLLGWGHAKALEKAWASDVEAAVVDKFAPPAVIERNLKQPMKLIMRVRAEDNPAVAAASILARARYLFRLEKLSEILGVKLIPGSGASTDAVARELIKRHGPTVLEQAAKHHFKNTGKVI